MKTAGIAEVCIQNKGRQIKTGGKELKTSKWNMKINK
jgi:hypothetical protein